jgi:hypothetical protein
MNDNDDFYIGGPRDYDEQTDAFRFELDSMVERYKEEFDINTFVMIGALREKMQELIEAGNMDIGDEMLGEGE